MPLPTQLEVRDLKLVAAIADVGTVTRAGQQLHLTQSALSHQLADLERRLGGALFERAGRRMIPTALGERLAARARTTLQGLEEVEQEISGMAAGKDAVLRIATECYTCYHWLPAVLREFGAEHPSVDVRIVPSATERPVRALIAGTIDLCVVVNPVRDRRVTTTPLFDDELVLVVDPAHRLADRKTVDPSELRNERFVMYSPPAKSFAFQQVLAPVGVNPNQVSSVRLSEAILELVKAGLAVSLLAKWAVQPAVESGSVVAVELTSSVGKRQWQIATRSGKSVPGYVGDFAEFLKRTLERPPRSRQSLTLIRSVPTPRKSKRRA